MTRRVAVAGLVAAVLLLGCSVSTGADRKPGPESAPVPSIRADAATTATAVDLLRAGTRFVDTTSYRTDVDMASEITALAHTDNVKKRLDATTSVSGRTMEIRMIDDEVYLRSDMDLRGVGDGWMRLDPARLPAVFAPSFAPGKNDSGGSARLIDAIVRARVDGSQISGTIDVTRIGVGNGISFRPDPSGGFPDAVHSQLFRATLDAEGRLVTFLIPAANGVPNTSLRYSDFGAAVAVVRPEGAVRAPDALYPQLGTGGK